MLRITHKDTFKSEAKNNACKCYGAFFGYKVGWYSGRQPNKRLTIQKLAQILKTNTTLKIKKSVVWRW